MWDALKPIDGVTEEMLDRMAAMGIISIFDVEEIGRNVLEEDLEFSKQVADRCIDRSIIRSKEVTIEQEEAKIAEESLRAEEEAAAAAVLDGEIDEATEAVADSILDLPMDDAPSPKTPESPKIEETSETTEVDEIQEPEGEVEETVEVEEAPETSETPEVEETTPEPVSEESSD